MAKPKTKPIAIPHFGIKFWLDKLKAPTGIPIMHIKTGRLTIKCPLPIVWPTKIHDQLKFLVS